MAGKNSRPPPPAQQEHYTPEEVVAALVKTQGVISAAARELNCSQTTVRTYMAKYPEVMQARKDEKERRGDNLEVTLFTLALGQRDPKNPTKYIKEPHVAALLFALKTQYKDRGYTERIEHVLPGVPNELITQFEQAAEAAGVTLKDALEMFTQELANAAARDRPEGS